MIDKNTEHGFKTNDIAVGITEYPFHPGEEFHMSINPSHVKTFESVEVRGAPEDEHTLYLSLGEFSMWIKAEKLIDMLEASVKQYRKGWRELNKKMNT